MILPSRRSALRGDLNDGIRESLRGFLRQIVPYAALDGPVGVSAREFLRIGAGVWVGCAVSVAFQCDRRDCDDRGPGEPPFQIVILRLAFSQAEPPTVIVDDDADVIR